VAVAPLVGAGVSEGGREVGEGEAVRFGVRVRVRVRVRV
jgi:hypothetical protein